MTMPRDIPIVDLMLGIPNGHEEDWYEFLKPQLREESKDYEFPAQYMFHEVPHLGPEVDHVAETLRLMDRHNIERAMVGVSFERSEDLRAVEAHPDRFFGAVSVDPNRGMAAVRDLRRAYETMGVKAAMAFPAGCLPQVPIDDARFFPIYAACIDLDIPLCMTTGICGPRVPSACQATELIDAVCAMFPELKLVMRHGAEPWADVAVKLLLKWPNLTYSTSAFAPRYYPPAIVDFANSRGADKVMYAGYFPMGLSLDRIMAELPEVPFREEVWPKFLRENAVRVFKLDG